MLSCGQPALPSALFSWVRNSLFWDLSTSSSTVNVTALLNTSQAVGVRRALGTASVATRAAATHQGQHRARPSDRTDPPWMATLCRHCSQQQLCQGLHQHKHMAWAINTANNDLQAQRGQTGGHLHNALPRSCCFSERKCPSHCLNSSSCTEETLLPKKKWK